MLISFRVKNFRSIVDTTINMVYAEGKAPNGYKEMELIPFLETKTSKRERVVPCLALYGPNAGGKTNLIRAMHGLTVFISKGVEASFERNKLHPNLTDTCFEICFEMDKETYSYDVCYSNLGVSKEVLKRGNSIVFSITKDGVTVNPLTSIFYPEERLKDILKVECSNQEGNQIRSFLGKIGKDYPGLNRDLSSAWSFLGNKIEIYPSNEFQTAEGINNLASALNKEDHPEMAFSKIETLIKRLDFGIKRMTFNREKAEKDEDGNYRIKDFPASLFTSKEEMKFEYLYSFHEDSNGEEVRFNFVEESTGTRAAFGLLGVLLAALEKGQVVVIDELDRSLHPLVFKEIVQLFKDRRYNERGAQLIFTAHNLDLLDSEILRISEVGIVNKTLRAGTTLVRLVDFNDMRDNGIRNTTNFRRRYLSGEFAGLPFPYI